MSMIGFDVDDDVPTDHRGRPIGPGRPGRRPSRIRGITATVVALAVLVAGGVAAYAGIHSLVGGVSAAPAATDYTGEGTGTVSVVVASGATVTDIAASLVKAGVIATAAPFIATAESSTGGSSIQPGTYRLHAKMSSAAALALLLNPSSRLGSATVIPEGQRLSVTLAAISRTTKIPVAQLQAAAAKPSSLGVPAWGTRGAEGFLFPATYQFGPGSTATSVLSTMVTRFDTAATAVNLVAAAKAIGRTPYQVLTVASLVQAEVPDAVDQAKVARVLYNRLAKGMPLQLDSTVKYVAGDNGSVFTTTKQRQTPSPYNTYLHAGLPPGPINSPGQQALMAALHPTAGPWLYYVTVNLATGETLYATTLAAHEKNVAQLQTWCSANPGRC
jgi:UPF0755 protein